MIVCPQPAAAEAGLEVLRSGGNAIDAAVTTAFCQGVLDPQMCGIGGSGMMLVHRAGVGPVECIEFHARAGRHVRSDQWEKLLIRESADHYGYVLEGAVNDVGYQSVGVPGTVAGLDLALRRHGTIAWADALAPAIRLARDGFEVHGALANTWLREPSPDVVAMAKRIQATAAAAALYTRDGRPLPVGSRLVQADYARTLETLAREGAAGFYRGSIAEQIAADFDANGGFVSREDLAAYAPEVTTALEGRYRGLRVTAPGPPAGGLTLIQMLNFLETFDLTSLGWPSVEAARLRVEAMRWAFADRDAHLADPRFAAVPTDRLLQKEYAVGAAGRLHDSPTTTHISVIDGAGNAVSVTHTLGISSGVVTPGLGFSYNNYLNCFDPRPGRVNSLEPGKTRTTMMVPTMVFGEDGLRAVAGAPGGTKIVGAVLQVLVNLLDHGMTPVEAVSAPRIDFQGEFAEIEGRVPESVAAGLRKAGITVHRRPYNYDSYFAQVQLISRAADGSLRGASDPRRDGGVELSI